MIATRSLVSLLSVILLMCSGLLPIPAAAQNITTDGSVGPRGTFIGPNYIIPADFGQTHGSNLFHSFQTFSVLTGESANFTGPNAIDNIFSRVTGGSLSNIDGLLTSTILGVNLFLLNPSGVLFGPHASVNIGGSFLVTTADYVRFTDGYRFSSTVGADGNFTSAAYAAFGFLGSTPAPIAFSQSTIAVQPGATLAVVGGDITLTGPARPGENTLQAQSGQVHVVSVASAGEVPLVATSTTPALSVDGFATLGTIRLTDNARIAAPPTAGNVMPGGRIVMRGGTLMVDQGSVIFATTGGDISAPPVALDIAMRESIVLDHGSVITANNTGGLGNGGNILLSASTIELRNSSALNNFYASEGNGSELTINTGRLLLTGGADIIGRNTGSRNLGNGGAIVIAATESMAIGPGSAIQTENFQGTGIGSPIRITTPSLTVEGAAGVSGQAGISGITGGFGPASTVTLNVGTLDLKGQQALIDTRARNVSIVGGGTPTQGGGPITVQGQGGPGTFADRVTVSGQGSGFLTETEGSGSGGALTIAARQLIVKSGGLISANTTNAGRAGLVTLNLGTLDLASGGRLESSTTGTGNGGTISVTSSGDVTIGGLSANGQSRSGIFAKTQGTVSNAGAAGDIVVSARNLALSTGAQIDSSTTSGGAGGLVSIAASDHITVAGASTRITSGTSRGNGPGGNVALQAGSITISDLGSVTAATGGSGKAGNIMMTAQGTVALNSGATVTSSTSGSGNGGEIKIKANNLLLDGPGTAIKADTLRPFADLSVTLDIAHLNVGDLVAQLDSPAGTRVALFSKVGGTGDNFVGTTLNDSATVPITSGTAPFRGTFLPREPLAQLNDQPAGGSWTLNLRDTVPNGTAGTLQGWSLQIGSQTFQSSNVPLNIPDNGPNGLAAQSSLIAPLPANALVPGTGEISGIGGNVTIDVGSLTVQNGAAISATTRGSGHGGTLNITTAGATTLVGIGSGLFSDAHASGTGGDIMVKSGSMAINSGAATSASSSGTGDAGNITIETPGLFQSTGGNVRTTAQTGQGGDITMTAGEIRLNGATISASSQGPGDAGTIRINSGVQFIATDSAVTTEATQGSGGNIEVAAVDMIRLTDSQISTSVKGGFGTAGGDITIDPNFVILQNSKIVAQAFQGQGGNINITAGTFLADPTSIVDASSQLGVSGTVNIQAPVSGLSSSIAPLSEHAIDAAALIRASCAARFAGGDRSSLVQRGRDTLPADPGTGMVTSPLLAGGGLVAAVLAELEQEPSRLLAKRDGAIDKESPLLIRVEGVRILEENAYCRS